MSLFYCKNISFEEPCILDEIETHHLLHVLRYRKGAQIYVFDGNGNRYTAVVTEDHKKNATIKVLHDVPDRSHTPHPIHIAVAIPKNPERWEWMIEKLTETGVCEITPLVCIRSTRKAINRSRSEKILISACKQSHNLYLPRLHQPADFSRWVTTASATHKFIAWCGESATCLQHVLKKGSAVISIGPEGDFTDEEVQTAIQSGFRTVSLGALRLRTETAAIYAAVTAINENM
ncbi:MAG: 16S rRNA (uracil(1498)-N(3))-methyltransferase [Chitinophagales bacterium]|nr:16S rRNA (uracil(1498)-N(3))-methyltransferase [Chitinophagales bacterium]MDW8419130.1 RsmE family RNA methyltransferase [Chitinophagales bacterium]